MKLLILSLFVFSFETFACNSASLSSCERKGMSKVWKWDDKKLISLAACKNGKPNLQEEKKLKEEYIRYAKASMRYSREQKDAYYFPLNAADVKCKEETKMFNIQPKISKGLNDEDVCLADLKMEIEANCTYVVFDEGIKSENLKNSRNENNGVVNSGRSKKIINNSESSPSNSGYDSNNRSK